MSGESEQVDLEGGQPPAPISHGRIVLLMCAITVAGSLTSLLFAERSFALGVLLGGAMSMVSYVWLKGSLGSMFEKAVQGELRQFQAVRFFLRYVLMGAVLYVIYLSKAFPMIAVLLGLASFAGAVIIEGFSRAISGLIFRREDR